MRICEHMHIVCVAKHYKTYVDTNLEQSYITCTGRLQFISVLIFTNTHIHNEYDTQDKDA